ncbi:Hsp90 co-chaperone AHA1 [Microthyrium microscopicum]|uniref:Hsp90 co-chaperone AHA1 n=1 Tax=Microthyrium microscopicum TaxID=703497 RepID=A0A6A6UTJ9_9PEZI|nr:Hsp90 co-chaperone AHA1 [Microthyrium microscopicum]
MVLHNPNNWHWVNKDASPWAKAWLEKELVGLKAEDGEATAKIDSVLSMDGDVDVSQRKGKVITLFDVKLKLDFSGKIGDDATASGSITIPEVAHDTEEHEYVFDVELYSEDSKGSPIKDLVRKTLVPQIRTKLPQLAPALITEHGKDLQHAPGSNPSSGFSTPKYISNTSIPKSGASDSKTMTSGSGPSVNVTTLTDSTEFRTSADQLYQTFTDPGRISAFTRSAPTVFEGAKVGGKFELFGGNISGSYLELEEPKRLVQKWRLAQWPQGHYSTLKIRFEQNDVDHVTVMRVDWEGVPKGQEDVTKRNWGEYYVRSIKTTFGFGTVL